MTATKEPIALGEDRSRRFMNLTQMVHWGAVANPKAIVTQSHSRSVTYSAMKDKVAQLAGGLKQLGLTEGDRVAILSLNCDCYTEYYFSVWWAGGVVVPLNTRWSVNENAYSLNDSGARILFIDDTFVDMLPKLVEQVPCLDAIVYIGEGSCPDGAISYDSLLSNILPVDDAMRCEDDLAGLFYTGGTTGFPKGVMLGHRGLWFNGLIVAKECAIDTRSVVLHAAPMFHLADGCLGLATSIAGGRHVYVPSFDPEVVLKMIEESQVTHLLLVPTMIGMILQHPSFSVELVRSLQTVMYGASPMPKGVLRQAIEQMPHVRFVQAYGQTEMSPIVSFLPAHDHVLNGENSHRLTSAGKVAMGCEVKILGDDGIEANTNEVGEIVARSPGSMLGYWNMPDQSEATLNNGWVQTGDGGYLDEDGYLYIVDRMKDMIITGGENVFSAEVESTISTYPGVAAVAVIGIPSERWGESVHAIVVPQSGENLLEADIMEHCRTRIANYKIPRSVEFRIEPLPLTAAGKVLKRDLRKPFWESGDKSVS